jgi:hypothetical protein
MLALVASVRGEEDLCRDEAELASAARSNATSARHHGREPRLAHLDSGSVAAEALERLELLLRSGVSFSVRQVCLPELVEAAGRVEGPDRHLPFAPTSAGG